MCNFCPILIHIKHPNPVWFKHLSETILCSIVTYSLYFSNQIKRIFLLRNFITKVNTQWLNQSSGFFFFFFLQIGLNDSTIFLCIFFFAELCFFFTRHWYIVSELCYKFTFLGFDEYLFCISNPSDSHFYFYAPNDVGRQNRCSCLYVRPFERQSVRSLNDRQGMEFPWCYFCRYYSTLFDFCVLSNTLSNIYSRLVNMRKRSERKE